MSFSVKFSIKSFKVPELYIEVPETATVGSLKVCVLLFPSLVIKKHAITFNAYVGHEHYLFECELFWGVR